MRCIPVRLWRQDPGIENFLREPLDLIREAQQRKTLSQFQPLASHRGLSEGDFVQYDLGDEELVGFTSEVPPVPRELLTRRLNQVTGRTRNDIAGDRALDVHPHGTQ